MSLFAKKRHLPKKKRQKGSSSPRLVLIRQILVGFSLILLIASIGYGVWHGSRIEALTINEVEVIGGETIPHETIETATWKVLEGEYFRLVPRRFAWTYPADEITSTVKGIERVQQAHVEREKRKLIVAFVEYQPIALWCKQASSKDCLFLDRNGYAFAPAPWLEGTAFMRYSDPGREPTVGLQAFSGEFIEETNTFVENAYYQLGINIIHVEKKTDSEIDYHISGGGLIKVSTDMTTQETLENLAAILSSEEFAHLEPGNFRYIDLRYGDKIFINEELEEPDSETASSTEAEAATETVTDGP